MLQEAPPNSVIFEIATPVPWLAWTCRSVSIYSGFQKTKQEAFNICSSRIKRKNLKKTNNFFIILLTDNHFLNKRPKEMSGRKMEEISTWWLKKPLKQWGGRGGTKTKINCITSDLNDRQNASLVVWILKQLLLLLLTVFNCYYCYLFNNYFLTITITILPASRTNINIITPFAPVILYWILSFLVV